MILAHDVKSEFHGSVRPNQDTMTETFGKRLAQARREYAARVQRDVTGPDLAAMVGVSQSAEYKWENDMIRPRSETIARLAQLLGVTPGWLDYGQEPKWPAALVPDAAASVPEKKLEPVEEEPSRPVRRKRRGGAA